MISFTIPESLTALPVRDFLKKQGFSTNYWKKVKFSNTFRCNGELISHPALLSVKGGDVISWELAEHTDVVPEDLPLDICYEDESLLIVNKPAGQLVHPTGHEVTGTLANAVLGYYQQKNIQAAYHPVHRLDRNTTGLVLIAKQPYIHHLLSPKGAKLFKREYISLVTGSLCPSDGSIDAPIARDLTSIIKRKVDAEGHDALTHYKTIAQFHGMSLLWLKLKTGRTHQIRVHLSHLGHPLVGDDLYGGNRDFIGRQALHAARISLLHPMTKREISVTAPIPDDIKRLLPEDLQIQSIDEILKKLT